MSKYNVSTFSTHLNLRFQHVNYVLFLENVLAFPFFFQLYKFTLPKRNFLDSLPPATLSNPKSTKELFHVLYFIFSSGFASLVN
jgi:hypothetical protein